ncbi:uncharacterized protein KGF55_005738 [Candida pseudojiufengensis]|uniref:uncharacterized protein n=1 Tax=Candida pseudojiufengensis TaxID=497109 RepID=UPI002224B213|nr:uncharacterized protein KGF55_005738 [Candida pseudojiufengensis]KAI5958739.1 hypothetical protein KGF55_005738 [Candida pseudojiufengensis]
MSKNEYFNTPDGPPPAFSQSQNQSSNQNHGNSSYVPQAQPSYNTQQQDRAFGYHHNQPQQGYGQGPPPNAYYQHQPGYGQPPYGHPPQGYYQQQQPMYVQQQKSSNNNDCLMACLAAMCVCCTLDMIF